MNFDIQHLQQELAGQGEKLKEARLNTGFTVQDVAHELRMPIRVIEAIESEQWHKLGAPVYIKGQLRSYAKLVKTEIVFPDIAITPTTIEPRVQTPTLQRLNTQFGGKIVYVVITGLIILPVWFATQTSLTGRTNTTMPLMSDSGTAELANPELATPAAVTSNPGPTPVAASMAPMPRPATQPAQPMTAVSTLTLKFNGDSWVKVKDTSGKTIEEALLKAGDQRQFQIDALGDVVLGNATQIEATANGKPIDLTTYMRANVAKFSGSELAQPETTH